MKDVTVVVPARNAEEFIDECLSSIDYSIANCILVDDYSTDKTLEKAKKYDVKIVRMNRHKGQGVSKNIGIGYAILNNAKYVMFLDSDDYFEKDAISKMRNAVEGYCLAVCNSRTFGEFKRDYGILNIKGEQTINEKTSMKTPCVAWNKIYDIDSLAGVRFSETIPEDNPFWFKYCCKNFGKKANYIPEVLHNYRQHSDSCYNTQSKNEFYDAIKSSLDIYDWLLNNNLEKHISWYLETYFLQMIKHYYTKTQCKPDFAIEYALELIGKRGKYGK